MSVLDPAWSGLLADLLTQSCLRAPISAADLVRFGEAAPTAKALEAALVNHQHDAVVSLLKK